jgi:RNA polymerase sigma-70 factor, ECF subfamily
MSRTRRILPFHEFPVASFSARSPVPDDGSSRDAPARGVAAGPPLLTPLRELQLVEGHRAGDADALTELLQAYQHRIYSVCHRMVRNADDAADLTQETLVKVIEGLDTYDGRAKLSTWVIRVAMNCCLTHLRKEKVRGRVGAHQADFGRADLKSACRDEGWASVRPGTGGRRDGELSAPQRVEQAEMMQMLRAAVMELDPDMRAVLVLRDMQGLEYEQIGQALDVPLGTVKSRLFRAREALRATMEARMQETPESRRHGDARNDQ